MTAVLRFARAGLHAFAHAPRGTFLRKALFQVHLWAGLGIGLLATVAGISGSAIVYKRALEQAWTPSLYRAHSGTRASADVLLAHARAAHPGWRVDYVDTGAEGSEGHAPVQEAAQEPWIVYLSPPSAVPFDHSVRVFVDPSDGRVLGEMGRSTVLHPASWIDWIAEMHYRLLAGETGLVVNGVGAGLLAILCVTGVVIWWPGRRHWRSHLKIHWHARWPRLNWDLHNVVGLWITPALVIEALTGAFFCFYSPSMTAMIFLLGGSLTQARAVLTPPGSTLRATAPVAVEPLLRAGLAAHPDCMVSGISPAGSPAAAVLVRLATPHAEERGDFVQLAFDQYTGRLLRDVDTRRLGFAIRAVFFLGPLHFGSFAGQWSKVAWVLLGIAPGLLFFTGFLMWWRRVKPLRGGSARTPVALRR